MFQLIDAQNSPLEIIKDRVYLLYSSQNINIRPQSGVTIPFGVKLILPDNCCANIELLPRLTEFGLIANPYSIFKSGYLQLSAFYCFFPQKESHLDNFFNHNILFINTNDPIAQIFIKSF